MSWSISVVGSPAAIAEEIERYGESLTGQCQVEFNDAKPGLLLLVNQNFNRTANAYSPVLHLEASGHGHTAGGEQVYRGATVSLKPLSARIVTQSPAPMSL